MIGTRKKLPLEIWIQGGAIFSRAYLLLALELLGGEGLLVVYDEMNAHEIRLSLFSLQEMGAFMEILRCMDSFKEV